MLRLCIRLASMVLAVSVCGCADNSHLDVPDNDFGAGPQPAAPVTMDDDPATATPPPAPPSPTADSGTMEPDPTPPEPMATPRPIWTCKADQFDSTGLGSFSICADFPEALGWSEQTAREACDAINGTNEFAQASDCDGACITVAEDPNQRCQDATEGGTVSFRYGQPDCGGVGYFIGEFFGAPADDPDQGPFTCYNEGCGVDPDDTEVITCRYASDVAPENCADFPKAEGWTTDDVQAHCETQMFAQPDTVVVVEGDSCLVGMGGTGGSARCSTATAGRAWFAYGAPQSICESFIGDEGARAHEEGPFCSSYHAP